MEDSNRELEQPRRRHGMYYTEGLEPEKRAIIEHFFDRLQEDYEAINLPVRPPEYPDETEYNQSVVEIQDRLRHSLWEDVNKFPELVDGEVMIKGAPVGIISNISENVDRVEDGSVISEWSIFPLHKGSDIFGEIESVDVVSTPPTNYAYKFSELDYEDLEAYAESYHWGLSLVLKNAHTQINGQLIDKFDGENERLIVPIIYPSIEMSKVIRESDPNFFISSIEPDSIYDLSAVKNNTTVNNLLNYIEEEYEVSRRDDGVFDHSHHRDMLTLLYSSLGYVEPETAQGAGTYPQILISASEVYQVGDTEFPIQLKDQIVQFTAPNIVRIDSHDAWKVVYEFNVLDDNGEQTIDVVYVIPGSITETS